MCTFRSLRALPSHCCSVRCLQGDTLIDRESNIKLTHSRKEVCQMDSEAARLRLEPFNDSCYEGLRLSDNDSGVMCYINKWNVKTPEETRESISRVQAR